MTTNFFVAITTKSVSKNNLKKSKLSKRTLGMESLESREMLSVNPLGIDINYNSPDFVQTNAAQDFQTEADETVAALSFADVTYKTMEVTVPSSGTSGLGNEQKYYLQYNDGTADDWKNYTSQITSTSGGGLASNFVADLTDLDPNITYNFRLNTADTATDASAGTTVVLSGTQKTANPAWSITSGGLTLGETDADNELTINLSGLLNGTTYKIAVVDSGSGVTSISTPSDETGGTLAGQNFTANATSGSFKIKADSGLVAGAKVAVTLTAETNVSLEATILTAATGPTIAAATTNATSSPSGVTSNAVTLTWTKPTAAEDTAGNMAKVTTARYTKGQDATDYKITLDDGAGNIKVYYSQGKTTLTITDGIVPGKEYSYKIENKLTATATGVTLKKGVDDYVVVASGLFETATSTLADKMAVGRPTDVKTTPTDSSVKITWKAPVNYTGGYKVTVTNLDDPAHGTFVVAAGAKTEATITFGTQDFTGTDPSAWKLTSGKRYSVEILPTSGNDGGANGLESTITNFVAKKTQSDPTPTFAVDPPAAPLDTLFTITPGVGNIVVKKTGESVPAGVDGYYIVVAQTGDIGTKAVANATYVTKAQFEATSGVTIGNLPAHNDYDVKIFAANSAGASTTALTLDGTLSGHYNVTTVPTSVNNTPDSAKNVTATKDTTVANKVKVTWESNDEAINTADPGYAAKSYDVYYSIKDQNQWVLAGNVSATTLELTVENLLYAKDYDFAVVANCDLTPASSAKVAVLKKATSSVTTGAAPTVTASNILTAKSVAKDVAYANDKVTFTLTANTASGTKVVAEQYYVVLRDANKAVIHSEFLSGTITNATLTLGFDLTPKAKYTVEVYGVVGTTIGTTKVTGTLSVADYPAATLKVTTSTKPTVNTVSITVTDKTTASDKFYYVQYTSVADAKSKPDWSTATVEKLVAANVTATGGNAYVLGNQTKLDPNTQYYVRIVTSDTNVAIDNNAWKAGTAALDDWGDATNVVFGKEIKVKTAAVPLATVGKPGFGFNASDYAITLKTVGQTMLSAKGAGDIFGSGNPLENAAFTYKLLVSQDSKVDKVTGKLLGSAEITLTKDTNIKIEELPAKGNTPKVTDGQYTLEYALTGDNGILKALGLTASNASSLKNLNFQLVTTVTYSGVSFDSVTKPGKVAMPKWFV